MESKLLNRFDSLCSLKGYSSRSEAIRDMVRDHLVEAELGRDDAETVGTLTVVYDHHQPDLQEKLTRLQHRFLDAIISSLHVHLDVHLCLEVIVLKGRIRQVKKIADGLLATKGVKHGKLVVTTQQQ